MAESTPGSPQAPRQDEGAMPDRYGRRPFDERLERRPFRERRPYEEFFERRPFFDRRFWGIYPWGRGTWDWDPYWGMPWGGSAWGWDPYWGAPWRGGAWGGAWAGSPYRGMPGVSGSWREPDCKKPVEIAPIWYELVDPIVCHGCAELERGQSPEHTLRECSTMGVLAGMGMSPETAIEVVEEWERRRGCRPAPCPNG